MEEEEEKEESARIQPNLFECIRGEGRERRNEMTRLYIVPLLLPLSLFLLELLSPSCFYFGAIRMREVKVCVCVLQMGGRHMSREIALFLEGKCILPRARCQIWEDNVSEDVC